jgi:hypothetical protein
MRYSDFSDGFNHKPNIVLVAALVPPRVGLGKLMSVMETWEFVNSNAKPLVMVLGSVVGLGYVFYLCILIYLEMRIKRIQELKIIQWRTSPG